MVDHYKILGIERDAKPEEVKRGYFEMAKKYHPDSGDENEIKKFHEVSEAYKVLSNAEDRKAYDLSLGAVETEEKKVETGPKFESVHTEKRESYRDVELKEFHRNRYMKAVLRVILTSVVVGLVGLVLAVILEGRLILGALAGVCVGFGFSINQNFNIRSFFNSGQTHKFFRFFTWFLLIGGVGYFVWLIVMKS